MIKALDHSVPEVRVQAAEMLGQIGKGNAPAKTALQKATQDENEAVRKAAEKALANLM